VPDDDPASEGSQHEDVKRDKPSDGY